METLALAETGFAWARARFAGIGDTPLDAPTPCENWSLRQLVNHAVNAAATAAGVLSDIPASASPSDRLVGLLGRLP